VKKDQSEKQIRLEGTTKKQAFVKKEKEIREDKQDDLFE
jgi:hypothetical protein